MGYSGKTIQRWSTTSSSRRRTPSAQTAITGKFRGGVETDVPRRRMRPEGGGAATPRHQPHLDIGRVGNSARRRGAGTSSEQTTYHNVFDRSGHPLHPLYPLQPLLSNEVLRSMCLLASTTLPPEISRPPRRSPYPTLLPHTEPGHSSTTDFIAQFLRRND